MLHLVLSSSKILVTKSIFEKSKVEKKIISVKYGKLFSSYFKILIYLFLI